MTLQVNFDHALSAYYRSCISWAWGGFIPCFFFNLLKPVKASQSFVPDKLRRNPPSFEQHLVPKSTPWVPAPASSPHLLAPFHPKGRKQEGVIGHSPSPGPSVTLPFVAGGQTYSFLPRVWLFYLLSLLSFSNTWVPVPFPSLTPP